MTSIMIVNFTDAANRIFKWAKYAFFHSVFGCKLDGPEVIRRHGLKIVFLRGSHPTCESPDGSHDNVHEVLANVCSSGRICCNEIPFSFFVQRELV